MMIRLVQFLLCVITLCSCAVAEDQRVSVIVEDAATKQLLAARLYLQSDDGKDYFFTPAGAGTAFKYEKQNWKNKNSIENHTTVSPHGHVATVPPGNYTLTVERGKEYFPHRQQFTVTDDPTTILVVGLKRWIDNQQRGWYSGDTHIHRTIDELRNIVMAEDLNVVFPLTNWVTISDTPPSAGNKNLDIQIPDELVRVDDTHVIWPRNTEYEIFSVAKQRHTLGALFVLGHKGALQQTVPPWKPVIKAAREADPDVLFDMDKLAWPFAMLLPTIAPDATYELANNHMWRTEFAFREWYTPTPPFIQPPFGGTEGGEREWIDFTLGMYYTLLDCGFRLPPSAGTANGVHPVPAGFGRVYVHLPDGFDYQKWRKGLQQGRSFVTTGPMLYATAEGKDSGHVFHSDGKQEISIRIEVQSEQPLTFGELLINGKPEILLRAQNRKTESGAYRSLIDTSVTPSQSGWFAVRFWEDRPEGRVRFAHSAPWYVEVNDQPVRPRREEKEYLVGRMKDEIQRSRGVVSAEGLAEYETALDFYRSLTVQDDADQVARTGRMLDAANRERWLTNMIVDHRFTADEVRLATGLSFDDAKAEVEKLASQLENANAGRLRIMPYPGGRHPRRSFLDGAIDPERETKVSVFPPWADGGYAVVDVPEAIFSNLGLTYLAHQHIPTIWSADGIDLDSLEWTEQGGALEFERELPNGIAFGSRVSIADDSVAMEMHLTNGTKEPLTGLRSQVCVMLKGLVGFNSQRRRQQYLDGPFVAIKADDADRWLITAWQPLKRAWTNPPVPCVHSDPVFPDCGPGKTVNVSGRLWFYEGEDIKARVEQLKKSF